jgi:hypothetical protein
MLENGNESHTSTSRGVRRFLLCQTYKLKKDTTANTPNFYTQLNLWQSPKKQLTKTLTKDIKPI